MLQHVGSFATSPSHIFGRSTTLRGVLFTACHALSLHRVLHSLPAAHGTIAMSRPTRQCSSRLMKELKAIQKDPPPNVVAMPLAHNVLEWHYLITGADDSPYAGGCYHGVLKFPPDYPFKPPGIIMITPSGRFRPNTRLCLSMSDFHPETWVPLWSVASVLTGVFTFMLDASPTAGSVVSTDAEKRRYAALSWEYNMRDPIVRELFPEHLEPPPEAKAKLEAMRAASASKGGAGGGGVATGGAVAERRAEQGSGVSCWLLLLLLLLGGLACYAVINSLGAGTARAEEL